MEYDDEHEAYTGTEIRARTWHCRQLLAHSSSRVPTITGMEWFEFRQAEFSLWSRTISAAAEGKSSLDHRLRHHSELRDLVCNLMDGLLEAFDDLLQLAGSESYLTKISTKSDADDETSSDGSSDGSEMRIDETYQLSSPVDSSEGENETIDTQKFFVETTILELARLSTKIRNSGTKYRHLKADASLNRHEYDDDISFWVNDILCRRVRHDPTAGIPLISENSEYLDPCLLTMVQKRLVDANLFRLNRIRFAQRRTVTIPKQSVETESDAFTYEKQEILPADVDLDLPDKMQTEQDQPDNQQEQKHNDETTCVSYTATAVGSQLMDLKISAIAETSVASRATRIGIRGDLEYPRCPKPSTDVASLTCPYCTDILPNNYHRSPYSWRKHVAQDILPYVCYYEQCAKPDLMYPTSDDLMVHINEHHSHPVWYCTQCVSENDSSPLALQDEQSWRAHMHHEHNCAPDLAEALAHTCQGRQPEAIECPLCTHWTEKTLTDDEDHILWHIHQFALNCLPRNEEDEWDSDRDADTINSQERIDDEIDKAWSDATSKKTSGSVSDSNIIQLGVGDTASDAASSRGFSLTHQDSALRSDHRGLSIKADIFDTYFSDALWSSCEPREQLSVVEDDLPSLDDDSLLTPQYDNIETPAPSDRSSGNIQKGETLASSSFVQSDSPYTIPTYSTQQLLPRPTKLIFTDKPMSESMSRVVKDVDKTNQVRGTGACNRCRLAKVPCSVSGICPTCVKACPLASEVCCMRKDMKSTARDHSSKRFSGLVRKYDNIVNDTLRAAYPEFGDDLFEGQIHLDRICSGFGLQAFLRNYKCMGPDNQVAHSGCTFSTTHFQPALSQQQLVTLAKQSLSQDYLQTFEGAIESFIALYTAPHHSGARQRPQFALLEKLCTFKAAYRICRSEELWFLQKDKGIVELPLPAQAELRGVARSALDSSESDIHSELDKYLKTPKIPDQDKPAVWAALWQLMFVYRDLLRGIRPLHNSAEALFNAVAVFYATMFRTTAALKCLDSVQASWLPSDAQSRELAWEFSYALSLRDTFYQSIVAGVHAIDQSLKILVVDPEMKVLKRRPARPKRFSGVKRDAAHGHDEEDETMGGC